MAPRKPNPSSTKGPDPGRIDDDTTAYLGISLIDDGELAKLVSFGALVEGQAFAPSKAVVPKFATVNSKTVITPAGTKKTVFGSVNFNVCPERSDLWLVNAAMSKWDCHWIARWFYHTIPFEAGSESAKALRCRCRAIAPNREPKIAVDGAMEARFALLHKVCSRLSCRDLVEEFCMLRIFPLSQSWQVAVHQGEEVDGLPKLVLPEGTNVLTLDQADAEARKMIGDVSVIEYSQLLTRQAAGRANRVYNGELPPRANPHKVDDDVAPSRKRTRGQVKLAPWKRRVRTTSDSDANDKDDVEERDGDEEGEEEEEAEAVVEKAADEAVQNRVDTPGYTPTPSPGHNETRGGVEQLPPSSKGIGGGEGASCVFGRQDGKGSDDESSDETPTSLAGRSLNLSTAPILSLDGGGAGGSAAAGASASADRIVTAAARVFGSPLRQPVVSPLVKAKGKGAAVETSALEYSLAAPHFAPGDFETWADLVPFVEGVCNLVLPASTPSLFTELNEFDEGCSAIKSLAVRIIAAHCSTEQTMRARLDGFKNRLRAKDDEIGRKSLEMEALVNTLKEAKAKNKQLQTELEKGKEARAKVDRLKAELEKEKAHAAVLTNYYNLTEQKMEALRLEVSKAKASAMEESQRFLRGMAKATESARTACQTLRLALTDMGARVRGVPAEDASAFDFFEWTQQGVRQKLCIRPPSGSWRSKNKKFVALKGLPKARCPFRPVYREMVINSRSYKVFKVAGWLRAHPG
uniref:Uncharacterized protein n=2 Tax=Oryza sativa subsp. japonica TaxID=39947 RepID=Q2R7V2_ORYSJ|nr:hypothetical protein LOC_Os11g14840 [Oryza sativa Japonica Group]ABA92406.1 hypothetical protein LOC_Os11g14840 [Oryza sativa Japonica Group]